VPRGPHLPGLQNTFTVAKPPRPSRFACGSSKHTLLSTVQCFRPQYALVRTPQAALPLLQLVAML
jgi:hypothetical protein